MLILRTSITSHIQQSDARVYLFGPTSCEGEHLSLNTGSNNILAPLEGALPS